MARILPELSALDIAPHHTRWAKGCNQTLISRFCRRAIVLAEITDVDVERDGILLRPGVDGQVRFRKYHGTRCARIPEPVEGLGDDRQPGLPTSRNALRAQGGNIVHRSTIGTMGTAAMQFSENVQAFHAGKSSLGRT